MFKRRLSPEDGDTLVELVNRLAELGKEEAVLKEEGIRVIISHRSVAGTPYNFLLKNRISRLCVDIESYSSRLGGDYIIPATNAEE